MIVCVRVCVAVCVCVRVRVRVCVCVFVCVRAAPRGRIDNWGNAARGEGLGCRANEGIGWVGVGRGGLGGEGGRGGAGKRSYTW